ncbi:HypC/HybG/HupF family hydrogenase formation chaperone [Marinobacterium sedimentorum]|jgi:hydrogenase expression/formation protein HypC|uniref:HypC/HybG/HupF family hydrogenase formation chaperone n=1 Tax=Marinobacterium sedimentorum TaxID=2927804 RepID=UPI0020C634ED|nr:HypC/HybG/HupF family hydrogenase formation chaperone [Marinobacterium sedimentorum]MCP8690342.1 HypC/HybG/HupF family hydrogenase formation chaperone [Marinobacterium sedimentorum]
MCLAIPACIVSISDAHHCLAVADSGGVQRQIDLSCVVDDAPAERLVGRWVLVHVGVALALISDEEARASLELWSQLQELP